MGSSTSASYMKFQLTTIIHSDESNAVSILNAVHR